MLAKHSYDVRGRQFSKALYWSETSAFGPRAYFVTISKPAALSVDNIQLDDEGVSVYSYFFLFVLLSFFAFLHFQNGVYRCTNPQSSYQVPNPRWRDFRRCVAL